MCRERVERGFGDNETNEETVCWDGDQNYF